MTEETKFIAIEDALANLLISNPTFAAGGTFSVPSKETITERDLEMVQQRPMAEAWCAWWIKHNGDAPVMMNTPEGKVATDSLFAFQAGWGVRHQMTEPDERPDEDINPHDAAQRDRLVGEMYRRLSTARNYWGHPLVGADELAALGSLLAAVKETK